MHFSWGIGGIAASPVDFGGHVLEQDVAELV